jgi:hypothetical protein
MTPNIRTRALMVVIATAGLVAIALAVAAAGASPTDSTNHSDSEPLPESASVEEVDRWVMHLAEGGNIRVRTSEPRSSGEEGRIINGLGRLDPSEHKRVGEMLAKMASRNEHKLEVFYTRSIDSTQPDAEWHLEESKLVLRARQYDAFERAYQAGKYIIVNKAGDAPPNPEGVAGLNIGVTHNGQAMIIKILARDADYGVDSVRQFAVERRHEWLAQVAYLFNSKDLSERQRMISRLQAQHKEDKPWRARYFPTGLQVDRLKFTVSTH